MRFQPVLDAKDDGGLTPTKDNKFKSGERSPFEARSDSYRPPHINPSPFA